MKTYTRADLDTMECAGQNCDHTSHDGPMVIGAACHPTSLLYGEYQDGLVHLICGTCGRPVADFKVATS